MSSDKQRDYQTIKKNERESDFSDSNQISATSPSELPELQQVLEVELVRIESQNRRTDIFHRAIEAQDAADQRQHAYHVNKVLENQREKLLGSHKFGSRLLMLIVGGGFIVISILLFNANARARY